MGNEISFKTKADAMYNDAKSCLSAVKCFQEYCESYTKKVLTFLESSETRDDPKMAFQIKLDDYHGKVAAITRSQYNTALEDEEALFDVVVDDLNDTVQVTGKDIVDAVEMSLSEVKVQSEYIKLCVQSIETRSSELASNIKAKFSSVTGDLINKYQDLWVSGNPVRSLQNLFTSKNTQMITTDSDGQIDVFDASGYGATNVWLTAFDEIGQTIASFFEGIWRGIQDLGGFFERLLDSFVNLAQWLMQKAFGQLNTNYENGGDRIGYIDVPLLQIPVCNLNFVKDGNGKFITDPNVGDDYNKLLDSGLGYNYRFGRTDGYLWMIRNLLDNDESSEYGINEVHTLWSKVSLDVSVNNRDKVFRELGLPQLALNLRGIVSKLYEFIGDESDPRAAILCKTVDIVVPCSVMPELFEMEQYTGIPYSPCDVLIRFGLKKVYSESTMDTYAVIMQIFAMATWDEVNAVPDTVTACRMRDSLYALYAYLSDTYWNVAQRDSIPPVPWTNYSMHTAINDVVNCIIDISNINRGTTPSASPYDLVSRLKLLDNLSTLDQRSSNGPWHDFGNVLDSNVITRVNMMLFINSIIMYCGLNGPGYETNSQGNVVMHTVNMAPYVVTKQTIIPLAQMLYSHVDWGYWPFDPQEIVGDYPKYISEQDAIQLYVDNMAAFTPYCSYYGYGVSVHYQTTKEQVAEAKAVIVAAVIAIVGVTLAIVTAKFLKGRKIKFEMAQAARDSFAWDLPANPSKEQIKQYKKLRKKANRISKLNGLLGLSSENSNTTSIIDTISNISDQLLATQGASDQVDATAPTIADIQKVITGD